MEFSRLIGIFPPYSPGSLSFSISLRFRIVALWPTRPVAPKLGGVAVKQGDGEVSSSSDMDATIYSPSYPKESTLETIAARVPSAFCMVMLCLGTGEVLRVSEACSGLLRSVDGDQAVEVRGLIFEHEVIFCAEVMMFLIAGGGGEFSFLFVGRTVVAMEATGSQERYSRILRA